jgi:hypothetical protein
MICQYIASVSLISTDSGFEMHKSHSFEPVIKPASWPHWDQLARMRSRKSLGHLEAHVLDQIRF